jgi:hypothetical protein
MGRREETKSAENRHRTWHRALVTRVLDGDGTASRAERRIAFQNDQSELAEPLRGLVDKIAEQPASVTDEDVAAVKAAGLSEDQIFELVICAAVGQATRQYETALDALDAAVTDLARGDHASRDPQ